MIKGLLAGVIAVPVVGAVLAYSLADWSTADYPSATFKLPLTTLACIPYYPRDGETLASWDFEQPVRMDFRGLTGTVTLHAYGTTTFHFSEACRFVDLGGGRMSDATLIIQ